MTILKWLGGLILTLVILLLIAIIIIPRVVDPNDYREKITSVVKQETGRDLKLAGDLSVSVFPWLGIRTEQLSISQPEEIGGDMLSVNTAQIRIKLLPLLGSRLEIDTVILEAPQVKIITLQNGVSSFSGLVDESTNESAAAEASTDEASTAVALVIQGLELTEGNLLWDDQQAGQSYQVNNLNLVTGNLIGDEFADLDLSGQLIDSASPDPMTFQLQGQARIDTDTLQVMAKGLSTKLVQGVQNVDLELGAFTLDQTTGIAIEELGLAVVTALINAESDESQPVRLNAKVPALSFNPNNGAVKTENVAVVGEYSTREFSLDIPSIAANLLDQKASIDAIKLTSKDLNVTLSNLVAEQFIDQPAASGKLNVAPFNAAALLAELGIDYVAADPEVLKNISFSTNFKGGLQSAELSDLQLQLDTSKLTGSVKVLDIENLAIAFDLVLDQLNLDKYLPAEEAAEEEVAVSGAEALAVPMAALQGINANGSFKANQLFSGGLELNDINVDIVSTQDTLTITPKANLYDGSIAGDIKFEAKEGVSKLHVKNNIDLVSLGKLLTDADVSDQLSGIGTLGIDVEVSEQDGVQTNEGTIKLFARNGALKGVDIKKILDSAYQQYRSFKGSDTEENAEPASGNGDGGGNGDSIESDETRFAELLGTFYLKDNRVTNDDFSMKAPLFRVSGSGDIDLAAESINYLVKVSVVASTSGQGGATLDELAGVTIPIRLKGNMTAPSYSIDMKALLSGLAKKELKNKKDQFLKDKLGISLSGDVSDSEDEQPTDKKSLKKDIKKKLLEGLFK